MGVACYNRGDMGERPRAESECQGKGAELNKIIVQLKRDYPGLRWRAGKKFAFRPPRTIVVEQENLDECSKMLLLHEVGHATLEHQNYRADVERLKMERAAWEQARKLCERYGVEYDVEVAERELDSYRDWLHRRASCPRCGLTRYQGADGEYHCPECG